MERSGRPGRARRALAAAAAVGALLTVSCPAGQAGASASRTPAEGARVSCASRHPGLAPRLTHDIAGALRERQSTTSLALHDRRTGTTCTLNAEKPFDSASVVKVTVLGALLRQAVETHRTLTPHEVALTTAMITKSDNASTSALWRQIGPGGVRHFLALAGMRHTVPAADEHWGLTQVTAGDQLRLLQLLTSHNAVLDGATRAYALDLMGRVEPGQRWGVSAGAPGTAAAHIKNGWLPRSTHDWRVHSVGTFTDHGHVAGMVVLSEGNPTMAYGITTIQAASRVMHHDLGSVPTG